MTDNRGTLFARKFALPQWTFITRRRQSGEAFSVLKEYIFFFKLILL